MFTLTPHQMQHLEAGADDAFGETVRAFLTQEYPAFLPRFPLAIQQQLTRQLIERAETAGAQTQQSIGQWCLLMLTMGPNLGQDPAVRAWLASTGASADQRIRQLDQLLSESDWARIDAHREDLPLLTPLDLDHADLPTRTLAALPLVLWEREHRPDDPRLAQDACASKPAWLAELQDTRQAARERLEMLRSRILWDHGRWA
jgi:hypothetical protein